MLLFPLKAVLFFILPFFVLLRSSIFLYAQFQWNPWLCLLCGTLLTMAVFFFYFTWLWKWAKGKKKLDDKAKTNRWIVVAALAGIYLAYGLTFISSDNAKTKKIREEYGALHPFLRMGVGTVALFDRELVVTDLKREILDYEKMGLGKKGKSLHFVQSDGFVHALDLRTNGRAEWRNTLLHGWFRLMGFKVHRHVGTADHLHVSLLIWERPEVW